MICYMKLCQVSLGYKLSQCGERFWDFCNGLITNFGFTLDNSSDVNHVFLGKQFSFSNHELLVCLLLDSTPGHFPI